MIALAALVLLTLHRSATTAADTARNTETLRVVECKRVTGRVSLFECPWLQKMCRALDPAWTESCGNELSRWRRRAWAGRRMSKR